MIHIKDISFKEQVLYGVMLIVSGNILAFIFHKGIFSNIAWIIYGLNLILNPVYPEKYKTDEKRAKLGSRIAGVICLLIGIFSKWILI